MTTVLTPAATHLDLDGQELEPHPDSGELSFPDGEVYVQLDLEGVDEAVVFHAGAPDPNAGLIQLYGILERMREEDVTPTVAFTYMPYGMQDEAFFPGTLNRARALLRNMERYYGAERVYAVDAHFSHRDWTEEFPFTNLRSFPLIQEAVEMEDYLVVGPDLGAVERFGIPGFTKERGGPGQVEVEGEMDVEGENVLVFDDIVETGGTLEAAYRELEEQGAERIQAAVVHGVLEEGVERVRETFDQLYLTNTVDRRESNVGVEPLLRSELNL